MLNRYRYTSSWGIPTYLPTYLALLSYLVQSHCGFRTVITKSHLPQTARHAAVASVNPPLFWHFNWRKSLTDSSEDFRISVDSFLIREIWQDLDGKTKKFLLLFCLELIVDSNDLWSWQVGSDAELWNVLDRTTVGRCGEATIISCCLDIPR